MNPKLSAVLARLCERLGPLFSTQAVKLPYLVDVGSGLVLDLEPWGLRGEPRVQDARAAGADLVLFSGDKLLGGPQAGCLVGDGETLARCRRHPIARAVRADKMTLAGLEATLALYRDPSQALLEIPVLRMLTVAPEELARHADVSYTGQYLARALAR